MSSAVLAVTYSTERQTTNNDSLIAGTIVVTDSDDAVGPARQDQGRQVLGVVSAAADGALDPGTVGVVSSGIVSVLVSDIAGPIKSGDPVTVSPINGIGMKASPPNWIIGIAQADFETSANKTVQQTVDIGTNDTKTVLIKELPLLLSVSYYSPGDTRGQNGFIAPVSDILESLSGRSVSTNRTIVALLVFAIAIIFLVTLVYSAVKNSLTAIGRNPLAGSRISGELIRVLVTAIGVIVVTLVAIYAIVQ